MRYFTKYWALQTMAIGNSKFNGSPICWAHYKMLIQM
jgi:hypothetical protein